MTTSTSTPLPDGKDSVQQVAQGMHELAMTFPRASMKDGGMAIASLCTRIDEFSDRLAALAGKADGEESWRCFHCDEVFTDREAAALHFGNYGPRSYTDAHCLIDAPKLRDIEFQLERYQEEDGPIHRLMHRQAGEHTQALQRAEEAGYAKALKDTNYSESPTPATGSGGEVSK